MQVVVDGLLTNYTKTGDGKVVLLLHGWGDNLHTFASLISELSNEYEVYAIDLPGFGGTETPIDFYSLKRYSLFIKHFVEKLSISKVHAVVGHSNGGAIAIKLLANNVIEVDRLVLLASSGIRSDNKNTKKAVRITAKLVKIPAKLLPNKIQKQLKTKAYSALGSDMYVTENMQGTFKQIVSEDLLKESADIKQNTLLIYGDKDCATPVSFGEKYRSKIRNSKLCVIDGAGHFVHQTNSDTVNELIIKFLDC